MNKHIIIFCILYSFTAFFYSNSHQDHDVGFNLALTSGFVWKNDELFKGVYGAGVINAITVDACYYPWIHGGIGIKTSYWQRKGETTILKKSTTLHEIPLIAYLRGCIGTQFQGYLSLGGGAIFIHERSYLGCVATSSVSGEAELGFNYYTKKLLFFTIAANALFPSKYYKGQYATIGGYGLRGGIGFNF